MHRRRLGWLLPAVLLVASCSGSGKGATSSSSAASTQGSTSVTAGDSTSNSTGNSTGAPDATDDSTLSSTTPTPPGEKPTFTTLPEIPVGDPDLRTGTLPNGLTYYVRNNGSPGGSAELRLAVNAGSARETADQSGVAHFLEHMMFNGTTTYPKNALIDVLRKSGAQFGADINASTSYDETIYQLNVPTSGPSTAGTSTLDTGVNILSEWLSAATLDPTEVEDERGVVLSEWRARGQNSDGRLDDVLQTMFLKGSPYEDRSPIGTAEAIQAMTPDRLRAFYDDWYRPDNAAVVIIGDIDVDHVVDQITSRFGPLASRGADPKADPLTFSTNTTPVPGRLADPDLTSRSIELTLPLPAEPEQLSTQPDQAADSLIFTMIANRLSDDATKGKQPFDRADVSQNDLVRPLDAPSVVVEAKTGQVAAAMQILLDEFERTKRFGFDAGELQRAVGSLRAGVESTYQGRDTRQDADYADGYAMTFLTGAPIVTEDNEHTLSTFVLDHMTLDFVDARFAYRWAHSGPRVLVDGPQSEEASIPSIAGIRAAIDHLPSRDLTARPPTAVLSGSLMDAPAPVRETTQKALEKHDEIYIAPTQLEFANGLTVILDKTPIEAGQVSLGAQSNGGIASAKSADVVDARVAADVVTTSGAGAFDQAQVDQLLAGSTVSVSPSIGDTTDRIDGTAASADVETLLALVHLYMADPNFDQVALDHELDDARSQAADPLADQASAAYHQLVVARYGGDPRFSDEVTADDADHVDLAGIERVWSHDFGNAQGWTFTIVGDIDVAAVTKLARSYLGTLASTGPDDAPTSITPDPPAGVVAKDIAAGTGDKATLLRLYSTRTAATVSNAVLADVATEVVSARILKRIREDLGESYSPQAVFHITPSNDGGDDDLDIYFEIGVAPDQIAQVSTTLSTELAQMAGDGPTDDEVGAAIAVVTEQYNYIDNGQLGDALLAGHDGVGQTVQQIIDRFDLIGQLTPKVVRSYLQQVVSLDRYIEVQAVPR